MSGKILAIASAGGHWEQLVLLRPALAGRDVYYVTTAEGMAERSGLGRAAIVTDFNRSQPWRAFMCLCEMVCLVWRVRPQIVLTTGAAPGLFGLLVGKLFGARAIWIDSVANAERLSMSGRLAGIFADLWLTQWKHLSKPQGPHYAGSVL